VGQQTGRQGSLKVKAAKVVLTKVFFGYDAGAAHFKGVDFVCSGGTDRGLSGHRGSGKSTIAR
jgi:ABC-type transport system involved in cytochrome bd biosynthesis fused ATPase/permease subunit